MSGSEQHTRDPVAGQVVLVTGGGGVIGQAICSAFARAGALVAVADLKETSLTATTSSIIQAGGRALGVPVDVADQESVERMVAQVAREL